MTKGYMDHYSMKQVRKEIMQECNNVCKECGGVATKIHHIDGSKVNHSKDNLMPVCDKCHAKIHHDSRTSDVSKLNTNKISSMIMLKGLSKKTFAEMIGMSASTLSIILNKKSTKDETVQRIANALDCDIQDILTEEYVARLSNIENKHYGNTNYNKKNEQTIILHIPKTVYDAIWTNNQKPLRKIFKNANKYIENILWDIAVKEVGDYKKLLQNETELDAATGLIDKLKSNK